MTKELFKIYDLGYTDYEIFKDAEGLFYCIVREYNGEIIQDLRQITGGSVAKDCEFDEDGHPNEWGTILAELWPEHYSKVREEWEKMRGRNINE